MDESTGISVDIVIFSATLVLVGIVVGHVYLDELLLGVQWFASTVVEPAFDLDQYF